MSDPQSAATSEKPRTIEPMAFDRLLLDPENPRLASGPGAKGQFELLRLLWQEMAVDELVMSIAANRFFPEEPLFIIPEEPDRRNEQDSKWIVVEGNRRFAAVLVLLRPDWRDRLRVGEIPEIDEGTRESLQTLPVSKYDSREQLWAYLSFRHINSPMAWDAFSKAQYVAHVHDTYKVPIDEIIRRIGDLNRTVVRFMHGYRVLQQAQDQGVFSVEDRIRNQFYFSHLYTAVDYPEVQQFLGIDSEQVSARHPVPDIRTKELGELMLWLYGKKSENKQPIVRTQNPDLNNLRRVLGNPEALDALRAGLSLDKAHEISIGDDRRFRASVIRAREELQRAKATLTTGYAGETDMLQAIQDVQEIARSMHREMKPIADRASSVRKR